MRTQVPFTIHMKIVPNRATGKRFEYIRAMQKIATSIYSEIANTNNQIQLAIPGGGQRTSDSGQYGGLATTSYGTSVKPQIGEFPSQIMITGFYNPSTNTNNIATNTQRQLLHCGSYVQGDGGNTPWENSPNAVIDNYCKYIKLVFETAASSIDNQAKVYRLEVAGINYGYKGYHFPI